MSNDSFKLSPSDFAFLWEECKRCFYLKIVSDFKRPFQPMPKIFTIIDSKMNEYFNGQRIENIVTGIPNGVVEYGSKWVASNPIEFPERSSTCYIVGRFDTVVKFDDGTYGVIDFKTSQTKSEHIPLYSRQLHAYAHALENPAPGEFSLKPISKLGLIVYEPNEFLSEDDSSAMLKGGISFIEMPLEYEKFHEFLGEVMSILEQPEPPGGAPSCNWCQYRDTSRRTGL